MQKQVCFVIIMCKINVIVVTLIGTIGTDLGKVIEYELLSCYPKDDELCLSFVKQGETLVQAVRDADVQIVRQTWV